MKKILAIILTLAVLLTTLGSFAACNKANGAEHETNTPEGQPLTILYLGDSIAEAVAGPSPVTEREAYGYYGIIGNINGYKFYNRAVSGYQTSDLLNYIKREDEGVEMIASLLKTADIIHISILGNDLLGYSLTQMMLEAAENDFSYVDRRMQIGYDNLTKIIEYIKSVNPNAVVIMQTLYNPIGSDSPLVSDTAKRGLEALDYTPNNYHDLASKIIGKLNDVIYKCQQDNAKKNLFGSVVSVPYEIVDVASAFENVYKRNPDRWATLFCPDGIHPGNEGHAIIASEIQKKLLELGLGDADNYLKNYKQLRADQLSRLYKDIINVSQAKNEINICEDMDDATLAYFNATKNYSAYYGKEPAYNGVAFQTDRIFSIDKLAFGSNDLTDMSALGVSIKPLANSSYIKFGADGSFEMKVTMNPLFITLLKLILSNTSEPINITDMIGLDISYLQQTYLTNMLPGFDYTNLNKTLDLLDAALGVSFDGINIDTQSARKISNDLAETGQIIIRDAEVLGDRVSIYWRSDYRTQIVTDKDGKQYTAIYLNTHNNNGEPYFRFTLVETPDEADRVSMKVEVVSVVVEGTDKEFGEADAA